MTLDDYSYISLHPNDDGTSWRLVTKQGQDAPRNENAHARNSGSALAPGTATPGSKQAEVGQREIAA